MAKPPNIFLKQRLTAGQLRAVADRRFDDAQALCDTQENARANGVQYLAGIAIEILLKAQLMDRYPAESKLRSHEVTEPSRYIWSLIWRSHDLEEMLNHLPQLTAGVRKQGERAGLPYWEWLSGICGSWTIFARYSTLMTTMDTAKEMLDRVRHLKEVLK
jgi:hypothetical protein